MGLNLGIRSTAYGAEDQSWLGSAVGTGDAQSVTLDAAACIAVTEFASGTIPSGIPLNRAGTGRYKPAVTGDTSVDAWLLQTVDLTAGGTQAAANTAVAAMWRGKVIVAKSPTYTNRLASTSAANTTVGLFRLV
jgi:hypothetical protein